MTLIWTPRPSTTDDADLLARVEAMTYAGHPACHPDSLALLGALSQRILSDPASRQAPQYVALGYWLRPAALNRLCDHILRREDENQVRTPRGVALHLPPTNVDTIFVYSWAMSVLAGNANVVRLSQALPAGAGWLASMVAETAQQYGEADRQLFCSYDYGGALERSVSRLADLRMIWGGDAKVNSVSQIPIRPDGLSIGFPDRKSLTVISSTAYGAADDAVRDSVATQFFNDTYWFDQMGCGSPRLLIWIGEPGDLAQDMYGRLQRTIQAKGYRVETGVAIGKFALANDLLVEDVSRRLEIYSNELHISRAVDPSAALMRTHGGGFLSDCVVASVDKIAALANRAVQTLTYFGLTRNELDVLARGLAGRGGYRIVPIGQALQFDTTWDGLDLYEHMTRRIVIR